MLEILNNFLCYLVKLFSFFNKLIIGRIMSIILLFVGLSLCLPKGTQDLINSIDVPYLPVGMLYYLFIFAISYWCAELINLVYFYFKNLVKNVYTSSHLNEIFNDLSTSERLILDEFALKGKSFIDLDPSNAAVFSLKYRGILKQSSSPELNTGMCRFILEEDAHKVLNEGMKLYVNSDNFKKIK
ncbi:MAG: super-infection exclusion protein B [Candidatus Phlomobacter fragariae]